MSEELDVGRRVSRRRMARISFAYLVIMSTAIISSLLWSPERLEIATALTTASVIVVGLLTSFVSIVLGYLGMSAAEKIFGRGT